MNAPAPIAPAQGPISPAPIAVRTASLGPEFFETDTGRRFEPRGFNYFTSAAHQPPALLYPPVAPSSDPSAQTSVTFLPGFYDPDAATAALGRMRQSRYNTVRLYLNAATAPLDSVPPGERLSPGYMANAADFIARARQSALRVILVFGYLPRAYDDIVEAPCARIPPDPDYETMQIDLGGQTFDICGLKGVGGLNALYMHRGIIEATGRFIVDSLDAIAAIDPTLLDSILGVDVSNEPFVWPGEAPFSLSEGSIALDLDGPKTYDLAALTGPASRQELADDATRHWASAVVSAVRAAHPDTLLSVSVFTPYDTGRSGYNGVTLLENAVDPRQPLRASLLAEAGFDYLDVHTFPVPVWFPTYDLETAMATAEIGLGGLDLPIVMGETGAPKGHHIDVDEFIADLRAHMTDSCRFGVSGWLVFAWEFRDTWWTVRDDDGAIVDALSPRVFPYVCPPLAVRPGHWLVYR